MSAWIDRHIHVTAIATFLVVMCAFYLSIPLIDSNGWWWAIYLLVALGPVLGLWLGYKKRLSLWLVPLLIVFPLLGLLLRNRNTASGNQ